MPDDELGLSDGKYMCKAAAAPLLRYFSCNSVVDAQQAPVANKPLTHIAASHAFPFKIPTHVYHNPPLQNLFVASLCASLSAPDRASSPPGFAAIFFSLVYFLLSVIVPTLP